MFKTVISSLLAITMFASIGTTVMAQDDTNVETTMVEVASYDTDLGDGVILRKTLSLSSNDIDALTNAEPRSSGTQSASVTHQVIKGGNVNAEIRGDASFVFSSDANNCSLSYTSYTIVLEQSLYQFSEIETERIDNAGSNPRYAKYSVSYHCSGFPVFNDTMWVQCNSSGSTSNNSTSHYTLAENQVQLGSSTITFG